MKPATLLYSDGLQGWFYVNDIGRSDELAKLPEKLADARVARWQSKYGRDQGYDPTTTVASEQDTGRVRFITRPKSRPGTMRAKRKKRSRGNRRKVPK
jgi:hypothetical protein